MDNEALVRRMIETIWNRGELMVADELFDPEYVNHGGLIPDLVHGPEAVKISAALSRLAFADLHVTVDEIDTDRETVVIQWTARRHALGMPGRAAVAAETLLTGFARIRFSGRKIVESWTRWDGPRCWSPVLHEV